MVHCVYTKAKSVNPSLPDLWRFYCWCLILRYDLDHDLWPWTFVVHWMWRSQIVYQILAKLNDARLSYSDLNNLERDPKIENLWPTLREFQLSLGLGKLTTHQCTTFKHKKLIRRWDSEREHSLRRHRTRTTKYNRLVHKFRHRSTRRLCVGTYVSKFSEITQCNGHYAVQGHSRSPILVPIESSYTTSY